MRMIPKRVLIVDDEENIGRSLRLILEREGYAVSTCHSVAEYRAQPARADAFLFDVRLICHTVSSAFLTGRVKLL